jgi:hypothetical protein
MNPHAPTPGPSRPPRDRVHRRRHRHDHLAHRQPSPRQRSVQDGTSLRHADPAHPGALTTYAQNNQDAYPPPDQAAALLIRGGLLAEEDLHLPGDPPGQASFFLLAPPAKNQRWGNSFAVSAPLIYASSTFCGGVHVGWNDGHVEYVSGDAAARFLDEYAVDAVPLR